jgi:alkanesulfonate monooxygenase SsuD/methylene tetrahydromethanopterin reductase-like flavin-dependent oxidoreductase (luciferase family)
MSMAYTACDLHRISGGRLVLGLGSQIKAHIVRRYDMPWSQPAERMRDYVSALRAIWHSWQTAPPLRYAKTRTLGRENREKSRDQRCADHSIHKKSRLSFYSD